MERQNYRRIGVPDAEILRLNKVKFADETMGRSAQSGGIGVRDFFANPDYIKIRQIAYAMIEGTAISSDFILGESFDFPGQPVRVRDALKDPADFSKFMALMNDAYATFTAVTMVERWREIYEFEDRLVVKRVVCTTLVDGSCSNQESEETYFEVESEVDAALHKAFGPALEAVWAQSESDIRIEDSGEIVSNALLVLKLSGGTYLALSGRDVSING
jgi:hypothetical protein